MRYINLHLLTYLLTRGNWLVRSSDSDAVSWRRNVFLVPACPG